MQVSWRREGLYIEAETDEERQFLVNCLESETLKPLIEASGEIDMRYGILGRPGEVLPKGKDGDANDISQRELYTLIPKSVKHEGWTTLPP